SCPEFAAKAAGSAKVALALFFRAFDELCRAAVGQGLDDDDLAAGCFDDLAADDLILRVVAALDEYLRTHAADEFERRVLIENGKQDDRFERRQQLAARAFILDRPARSLETPGRGVAVQPYDQAITCGARFGEHFQMAGMQEVEAAIGEADAQSRAP